MADQVCKRCDKLLESGDVIKAEIVTRFVALKSKLHYALERPTECRWVEHLACSSPKGLEDYDE